MKNRGNKGSGALLLFIAVNFAFLAFLMAGCSDNTETAALPAPKGKLALKTADMDILAGLREGTDYHGSLYTGIYEAPDEALVDVWFSVRELDGAKNIGTVERVGVVIQGGTGAEVKYLLNEDKGAHTFLIAINYRGSSLTDMTAEQECIPGSGFIPCLKEHETFSKTNPKLSAQDVNDIIRFFTDDSEFTLDGISMKPSEFVPPGTIRSPINLVTSSFGGVIVSYMLAEKNRPDLHNVFFEQVTIPVEYPISEGLNSSARRMDILFSACENDVSCNSLYPDVRGNFRRFMDAHHSTLITVDGENIYAGGVFDRIEDIIRDEEIGRAIRYIGEIANAHDAGDTSIDTREYGPEDYSSNHGEKPRATYGIVPFDDAAWADILKAMNRDFYPGITNRTGMICSFGINRAENPDSLSYYDKVKREPLPGDAGGTKEMMGYGFLISYKTYLSICPQLVQETGGLKLPVVSNIEAENVIVYRGGLDIKHYFNQDPNKDEIMAYFTDSQNHRRVITHKFLSQVIGQDSECLQTIRKNFWNAPDTTLESLGDDCEETNSLTASGLEGW